MSTKLTAKIPLSQIARIEIYVNTKRKTLSAIKRETGADYIINGGLFNGDWTPCPLLKVDGKMISKEPYRMWGYGWDIGPDIVMSNQHKDFSNYIGSTEDLVNPVEKTKTDLDYGPAFAGKRGRSAMGLTKDSLVLYCTKDGSSNARTMEQLQSDMFALGCETAIMLDGGGSSSCNFKGHKITTSRKIHNYVLVYLKGNAAANKPHTTTDKQSIIATIQSTLNERYSANLTVDGSFGPASMKAMIKAAQTEINRLYNGNLIVDGSFGPASKRACPSIKKVTKNDLVWLIQACLVIKGYNIELDGSYGNDTANVIKQFQRKNGLSATGICNPNTFVKLLTK